MQTQRRTKVALSKGPLSLGRMSLAFILGPTDTHNNYENDTSSRAKIEADDRTIPRDLRVPDTGSNGLVKETLIGATTTTATNGLIKNNDNLMEGASETSETSTTSVIGTKEPQDTPQTSMRPTRKRKSEHSLPYPPSSTQNNPENAQGKPKKLKGMDKELQYLNYIAQWYANFDEPKNSAPTDTQIDGLKLERRRSTRSSARSMDQREKDSEFSNDSSMKVDGNTGTRTQRAARRSSVRIEVQRKRK